jgi:hypothetical protein
MLFYLIRFLIKPTKRYIIRALTPKGKGKPTYLTLLNVASATKKRNTPSIYLGKIIKPKIAKQNGTIHGKNGALKNMMML